MTPMATQAYVDQKVGNLQHTIWKLMRRNGVLVKRISQLVDNQKHYLDYRAKRMKGYEMYAKKMVQLQNLYHRLKNKEKR